VRSSSEQAAVALGQWRGQQGACESDESEPLQGESFSALVMIKTSVPSRSTIIAAMIMKHSQL